MTASEGQQQFAHQPSTKKPLPTVPLLHVDLLLQERVYRTIP
jgi:hypothetical protein